MNTKVTLVNQDHDDVSVQCLDRTTYRGDNLKGAGCAYSTVHQCLHEITEKDRKLPETEKGGLGVLRYICMWATCTVHGNKISWSCLLQHDDDPRKDDLLAKAEWRPNDNQAMIDEIYNFPIKNGDVLGHLINSTDPKLVPKVYIEENVFEAWKYRHVALMGHGYRSMIGTVLRFYRPLITFLLQVPDTNNLDLLY